MNITTELLENGYIIHNDTQISVEVDEQITLFTVEDTDVFSKEIKYNQNNTSE